MLCLTWKRAYCEIKMRTWQLQSPPNPGIKTPSFSVMVVVEDSTRPVGYVILWRLNIYY